MENYGKGVRKGAWTKDEDILLKNCIQKYGEGKWHHVPLRAGLNRCRKSCRLRWLNYLRPNIKRGYFNKDEVDLLLRLHKLLGNRWSLIAGRLPGRTANDVKNFWNTHIANKSAAAGENCRRQKKAISKTNVIKPRPCILTIPHPRLHVLPVCSTDATKNLPSLPQEETVNFSENSTNNPSSLFSQQDIDVWWSSMLEITKNGEGATSFSLDDLCGHVSNHG